MTLRTVVSPVVSPVVVVELRDDDDDRDRSRTDDRNIDRIEGRVLVLDGVDTTTDNDHVYQALLGNPRVRGVLCLAIDDRDPGAAVRVRPAPSLAMVERAATLWVGHGLGVHWRPMDTVVWEVRPDDPSGLDHLIDALGEPEVFDTVVSAVRGLPHSTASVGMALARTGFPPAQLHQVWDEAVARFTDPDADRALAREVPRREFRAAVRAVTAPGQDGDVVVPDGPFATAYLRAAEALGTAVDRVTRLDHVLALFRRGENRPGRDVMALVGHARAAVRDFDEKARSVLRRVDDTVRGRGSREDVTELGVYGPTPVRRRQIRDDVQRVAGEWLGRYRSVAKLGPDLDAAKIEQEPQGCLGALDGLGERAPGTGPPPAFTVGPRALPIVLTALSGMLAALGVAPNLAGCVLVVLWLASGLLLHAREPVDGAERGFLMALKPAALIWPPPMLAGWVLGLVLDVGMPIPWHVLATVLSVVVLVATLSLSWRLGVRRWRGELDLAGLREWLESTVGVVREVLHTEWRPSARRALFAEGLRQVSEGMSAIREALAERAGVLFTVPPDQRQGGPEPVWTLDLDIYEELCEVVQTDLVDLAIEALEPCWTAIETSRPAAPADYAKKATDLMDEYHRHLGRRGLPTVPSFAHGDDSRRYRRILAERLWERSDVLDALVRGPGDDMVQLCQAGQLGAVTPMAADARLVRFAPSAVRALSRRANRHPVGDVPVTWTGDTEIAGTLRFVSLRHGVFE